MGADTGLCEQCNETASERYDYQGRQLCWACFSEATAHLSEDYDIPPPPKPLSDPEVLAQLARAEAADKAAGITYPGPRPAPGKPRQNGHIPNRPARTDPLPVWRNWLSDALGLPPEVQVQAVLRNGVDDADPVTIVLSNGIKMRCPHQKRLQSPGSLQAFAASTSHGIAQPKRLSQTETGDVFVGICVLGTNPTEADPAGDLQEHLAAFIGITQPLEGPLDREHRYTTIAALKARPAFDRHAAEDIRAGQPAGGTPVLLIDPIENRRYIRASEWIAYLRHHVGQTVDPSALVARMAEIGSDRHHPQAWNADRSHKHNIVLFSLPEEL